MQASKYVLLFAISLMVLGATPARAGQDPLMSQEEALKYCAASGGHLPSIEELRSLFHDPLIVGYLDRTGKLNQDQSYWSSSTDMNADEWAYFLSGSDGSFDLDNRDQNSYAVRCLRGR